MQGLSIKGEASVDIGSAIADSELLPSLFLLQLFLEARFVYLYLVHSFKLSLALSHSLLCS